MSAAAHVADARAVNSVAAAGVLVALAVTVLAARRGLAGGGRQRGDGVRIAAGAVAAFAGLPWIAAELGFYLDGVPLLGTLFETGERPSPREPPFVHHGHHHGMDGLLLFLSALLLSRVVPRVARRGSGESVSAWLHAPPGTWPARPCPARSGWRLARSPPTPPAGTPPPP